MAQRRLGRLSRAATCGAADRGLLAPPELSRPEGVDGGFLAAHGRARLGGAVRTVAIEYRWGEGRSERFAEIAAEFVRLKVDIIVTAGTAAVIAAKQATSVIPIVFGTAGDPVGTGLVPSLARPGGNVTVVEPVGRYTGQAA